MRRFVLVCTAYAAMALGAHAEENSGKSLLERGAELFLEGLRQEMEPAIGDLRGLTDQFGPTLQSFMQEMGPALAGLAAQIQDWSTYEAPEMLPNGDIVIRRKQEQPEQPTPQDGQPADGLTDI